MNASHSSAGTTPDSESGFVVQFSNGRSATTHGVTTAKLNYNAAASRLRSALVNLGHATDAPFDHEYVAGDVRVTRASTNNYHGYAWTVTFADCAPGGLNEGDLVPINVPEASVGDDLEVEVSEVRPGARSGGRAEVQVLRIYGDVDASTNETQPVRGFFAGGALPPELPPPPPAAAARVFHLAAYRLMSNLRLHPA